MPLGRLPLLLILFILSATSFGQVKPTDMGLELQVYPTGLLPGIRIDQALSPYSSIHLRGGFNLFDHQNFGVQDNEEGWGMGLTLGFRRSLFIPQLGKVVSERPHRFLAQSSQLEVAGRKRSNSGIRYN
jgi:hypothetical protein